VSFSLSSCRRLKSCSPSKVITGHIAKRIKVLGYRFLLTTNSMHFFIYPSIHIPTYLPTYLFMYLFIYLISLHVPSIKCTSSGDQIVLIHHPVWLVCVSDCLVRLSGGDLVSSWQAYQEVTHNNHTSWCINTIWSSDDEHLMLETCRGMK